jgi:hypothetical protein
MVFATILSALPDPGIPLLRKRKRIIYKMG